MFSFCIKLVLIVYLKHNYFVVIALNFLLLFGLNDFTLNSYLYRTLNAMMISSYLKRAESKQASFSACTLYTPPFYAMMIMKYLKRAESKQASFSSDTKPQIISVTTFFIK